MLRRSEADIRGGIATSKLVTQRSAEHSFSVFSRNSFALPGPCRYNEDAEVEMRQMRVQTVRTRRIVLRLKTVYRWQSLFG
jgi:hypothetical protein